MTIRLLYVLSTLAMVAAGGVLAACGFQWSRADAGTEAIPAQGQARRLAETAGTLAEERISPLMAAAQGFSSYLNPPAPPVRQTPVVREAPKTVAPVVRPPTVTPQFKLRGTICSGPSERSIALIWEPGGKDTGRWVKEGSQVGHFVIHEIRPGSVVYLDGERLCEMAIEREAPSTTVAFNGGSQQTVSLSQSTASGTGPARTEGRSKRPTGGSRFTVGSARTSTLD